MEPFHLTNVDLSIICHRQVRVSYHIPSVYSIMPALQCMPGRPMHCNPGTVVQSKPEDFRYEHDQSLLLPTSTWKNLEVHGSVLCSCEKCAKSSCPCRMAEVKCCNSVNARNFHPMPVRPVRILSLEKIVTPVA